MQYLLTVAVGLLLYVRSTDGQVKKTTPRPIAKGPVGKMDRNCFDLPRNGMCMGMFTMRWFFNEATSTCFQGQGCFYQGFMSLGECNKDCRCKQPLNEGSGSGPPGVNCELEVRKYVFAAETCTPFMYTGCGGNGNRFNTLTECMNTCNFREIETFERMGEMPGMMMMANGPWNGNQMGWGGSGSQMTPNMNRGGQMAPGNMNRGGQMAPGNMNGGGQMMPGNMNNGNEMMPSNTNNRNQRMPNNMNNGGQMMPSNMNRGSKMMPMNMNNGGQTMPGNMNSGGQMMPSNRNNGGQMMPGNMNGGGQMMPGNTNGGGRMMPGNMNGGGQTNMNSRAMLSNRGNNGKPFPGIRIGNAMGANNLGNGKGTMNNPGFSGMPENNQSQGKMGSNSGGNMQTSGSNKGMASVGAMDVSAQNMGKPPGLGGVQMNSQPINPGAESNVGGMNSQSQKGANTGNQGTPRGNSGITMQPLQNQGGNFGNNFPDPMGGSGFSNGGMFGNNNMNNNPGMNTDFGMNPNPQQGHNFNHNLGQGNSLFGSGGSGTFGNSALTTTPSVLSTTLYTNMPWLFTV